MSRSLTLYLRDIITSIDKIKKYTLNLTYEELLEDEKTLESVVYNLMIIGEATKKIPSAIRIKYSYIEWQKIAGLRDFIAHAYFSININIVWNVIHTKLDDLKLCVQQIINNETLDI
ncbi:DUF86 domain-containing protein [Cyanobacterium stanieri LEGE 03274]|uniref:DUF86 domain-containing protein n=1 Tax=Cyanobacterium stanieri LEGE 03274 TaxID=1828756 RepID=A0ABR9V7U3_9CHRO|nr:DUF86 domain-containing protein [Cyanobacterium stanieri]MBE9223591.1 DUF86 domain-containing protein [Cyanobacterium stanieri LEGE 03274]